MAILFDYLDWRGDVPLSVDPFNEVDNLVLAQLAYTVLGGIVPADGRAVQLDAAYKAFFERNSREEIAARHSFTAKAPFLMDEMVKGARFGNLLISCYVDEYDKNETIQMSAVSFDLDDGTRYIAFRGTDGTLVGWKEDFNFSYLTETAGQNRAVRYLDEAGAATDRPLRIGGHSKGGNLAVYAASFCRPEIQSRILQVYSNDGPGFRQSVLESAGYERILPRICSIVPECSIIGMLLDNRCENHVVESTASNIFQHDAFTWEVHRNRFVQAKLSDMSVVISNAVDDWISRMSDEERREFTDTLFSLFESTGKNSFREMSGQKWKSFEAMMTTVQKMPKEQQQKMIRLLGILGVTSGQAVTDYLKAFAARWNLET